MSNPDDLMSSTLVDLLVGAAVLCVLALVWGLL
jgi:hypothetical protein